MDSKFDQMEIAGILEGPDHDDLFNGIIHTPRKA